MTGTIWIPGAERITPSAPGGLIKSTAPPRVVWHTTEAPSGQANMFAAMIRVLKSKSAEPQILWDPITDRLGQFMPLNVSGRALKNDGSYQTNRTGIVCLQIEVIGYAKNPFTATWKPGPNFRAMMAAIRSWRIPDEFPMGPPPKFPGGSRRDRTIWLTKAGHYCHANVPGNDHGDPGAIDTKKLFAAAGTGGNVPVPPVPPKELFTVGQYETLLQEIKDQGDLTRREIRRQRIGSDVYELQTVDEHLAAERAFDNGYDAAKASGKSEAEALAAAQLAAATVVQPLVEERKSAAAKNEKS